MFKIIFVLSILALSLEAATPKCSPLSSQAVFVPHETDSSKFYICALGTPSLLTCSGGKHFNPISMKCVLPLESNYGVIQNGIQTDASPEGELQNGGCKSGALSPHKDCGKFYICVHGVNLARDCGRGLQWSSKVEQCVWPNKSDCGSQDSGEQDGSEDDGDKQDGGEEDDGEQNVGEPHVGCKHGALSRHEDCSKFYICDRGVNVAMNCWTGLQWSSKVEQCVWPNESDCGSQDGGKPDGDEQDGGEQDGGKPDVGEPDVGEPDVGEPDVGEPDVGEPDVGEPNGCKHGALSRHEDCSKFYICDRGVNVAMNCWTGLQWSSKVEQCVWPNESDCGSQDGGKPDSAEQDGGEQDGGKPDVGEPDVGEPDVGEPDVGEPDVGEPDVGEPNGCKHGALSRHEDCSKFYICDRGVNVAMNCYTGLQWNSKLEQCVWPNESDCGSQDGAETDSEEGGDQDGSEQDGGELDGGKPDSGDQDSSEQDGGELDGGKPDSGNQDGSEQDGSEQDGGDQDSDEEHGGEHSACKEGALQANKDCTKFDKCNYGVWVPLDCPAGLHWNAKTSECDWPASAGCVIKKSVFSFALNKKFVFKN